MLWTFRVGEKNKGGGGGFLGWQLNQALKEGEIGIGGDEVFGPSQRSSGSSGSGV